MKKMNKSERQIKLKNIIDSNPFLTDKELAQKLNVSIQTIRLDRLELNIPEVRKRTRQLAHNAYKQLKSVSEGEVIGELIKLELDRFAESYLRTTEEMSLKKSNIIRGHHIFAQANSLAVAVIDAELVLTGSVQLKYNKPVSVGETLHARAEVKHRGNNKFKVDVNTYIKNQKIFQGDFVLFPRKER